MNWNSQNDRRDRSCVLSSVPCAAVRSVSLPRPTSENIRGMEDIGESATETLAEVVSADESAKADGLRYGNSAVFRCITVVLLCKQEEGFVFVLGSHPASLISGSMPETTEQDAAKARTAVCTLEYPLHTIRQHKVAY